MSRVRAPSATPVLKASSTQVGDAFGFQRVRPGLHDGAMSYDTAAYIDPIARQPGWHDVVAAVAWTPRGGQLITVTDAYLDANSPTGEVFLGCGLEAIAEDLDLWDAVGDHVTEIVRAVDVQLRRHPWAVLECPAGRARLELVARAEM